MEGPLSRCQYLVVSSIGSVFRLVLSINYINDIDIRHNNVISKFADDTKIGNVVFTEGDRQSIKEDLYKLSLVGKTGKASYINKCQILQDGSRNIKNNYEIWGVKRKDARLVRDHGVTVESNLKFSQWCNESVIKASRMMGWMKIKLSLKIKVLYYLRVIGSLDLTVRSTVLVSPP